MDSSLIFGAIDKALDFCGKIFDWLGKGTLDKTEIEKAKLQLETVMAQLEFSKAQMQIWIQQALIDMEKATGAKWRTPLILITGIALVAVCVNNVMAYTYIPTARIISLASPEMGVLVGLFILLVVGNPDMLLSLFRNKVGPDSLSGRPKDKTQNEGEKS